MAEYTSTKAGFQKAMEESLGGTPENAHEYAEKTSMPGFYHLFNGNKLEWDAFIGGLKMWRGKISEYKPVIDEFLRDGDQLAARMTGTIKVDGADTFFESFLFAKVDPETGKMYHLIERAIWGAPGQEPEHGAN